MALTLELEDDDGEFTVTLDADGFRHVFGSGGDDEVDALAILMQMGMNGGPPLAEHELQREVAGALHWTTTKAAQVLGKLQKLDLLARPEQPTPMSTERLGPHPFFTRGAMISQFHLRLGDPETIEWLRDLLPDPPDTEVGPDSNN